MKNEQIISDLNQVYSAICALEIKGEQNILTRYNIMSFLHSMVSNLKEQENEDLKKQGDCNVESI